MAQIYLQRQKVQKTYIAGYLISVSGAISTEQLCEKLG